MATWNADCSEMVGVERSNGVLSKVFTRKDESEVG